MTYRQWPAGLAQDVETVAIQLPGRGHRMGEAHLDRMDDIVESVANAIRPFLDGRPLAFFGHSMGGLVAFELARALRELTPVAHVFVSACRGPRETRSGPARHLLGDRDLIAELRALGGTPDEVLRNEELLQLVLPVLRKDFAAIDTYAYREATPLTCPITAFGGLADRTVDREGLLRWSLETTGPFRLHTFPGDHFFIGPSRLDVTRVIDESLACVR